MPATESILRNEQTILRSELQELKRCQIQYFLISIGATGAIFGFNKDLMQEVANGSLLYLTPVLIILPCWLTFFDKANTITRLTGYVRVFIEEQLKLEKPEYFGYETALSEFRHLETILKGKKNISKRINNKSKEKKNEDGFLSFLDITRNQYWKICWLTFFLLTVTCFLYPYFKLKNFDFVNTLLHNRVYLIFLIVECLAFLIALRIFLKLIFGEYSYERVTIFWRSVLIELREKEN